jgi:hypothetical protein
MARHVLDTPTRHFSFAWYDNVGPDPTENIDAGPDALSNLEAVVAIAERDFATLAGWFGIPSYASFRRVDVRINLNDGGGSNGGYQPDLGINISGISRQTDPMVADEIVREIFVAELAEIMMDYRGQTVAGSGPWHAGDSTGEGLSRVMGAELHPVGYYGGGFASLSAWTGNGAPDWVDMTFTGNAVFAGDTFWPSFGCAVVFLYYLHTQLGHDWGSIIAADGATLQEKYTALGYTDNGFAAMTGLLTTFFGALADVSTVDDDPFPLWPDYRRSLALSTEETALGPDRAGPIGTVTIPPGAMCPAGSYEFAEFDTDHACTVDCVAEGYARPAFAWQVAGVDVPAGSSGVGTPLEVTVPATPVDPAAPGAPAARTPVQLMVQTAPSSDHQPDGQLVITDVSGRRETLALHVTVSVTETTAPAEPVLTASTWGTLSTARVIYDDAYYRDRRTCLDGLTALLHKLLVARPPPYIDDIRPDPDPIYRIAANTILAIRQSLPDLEKLAPNQATAIRGGLADAFGVDPAVFD